MGDESPVYFSGIFPLKEVENGVEAQGLQIQNLPDKRAGNPYREDDRMFTLRLQPLSGEVGGNVQDHWERTVLRFLFQRNSFVKAGVRLVVGSR